MSEISEERKFCCEISWCRLLMDVSVDPVVQAWNILLINCLGTEEMVSRLFTPIHLTPYHLTPIDSLLYLLTPLSFHPDFNFSIKESEEYWYRRQQVIQNKPMKFSKQVFCVNYSHLGWKKIFVAESSANTSIICSEISKKIIPFEVRLN